MSLDLLNKYDERTAEGILAAAALSTGYFATEQDQPQILKRFSREAEDLLREIRSKLRIDSSDLSSSAVSSIDKFLAKEISNRVLPGGVAQEALSRAGQAGRAPPTLYSVLQTKPFLDRFVPLGIRPPHVENAVKHPDEFQHLLNDFQDPSNRDSISLFLKEIVSSNKLPHWLLIQTFRQGLVQNVQSAWRVFPNAIDLSKAQAPLDVLKALVSRFGIPVDAAGRDMIFLESLTMDARQVNDFKFKVATQHPDTFLSFSWAANPEGQAEIGIGYCIDLQKYKRYLVENGVFR